MGPEIVSTGELLVEVMRTQIDVGLGVPAEFVGPFPSGAPAIFIDAAARLGARTGFIGAVGNDDFGVACLLGRLKEDGVDLSQVKILDDFTTGVAFVTYFSDGSRQFIFHIPHAAAGQIFPEDVDEAYLSNVKMFHVTGSALCLNDHTRAAVFKAVDLVKERGGKVSFDPNLRPELLGAMGIAELAGPVLEACDVLLPSGEEATLLTGGKDAEESCRELAKGVEIVALKLGRQGCKIFTHDESCEVPAFDADEVDPTGAGDCFGAALVVALLEGQSLPEAGRFANAVGALAVTRKGPMEGAFFRDEVLAFMETHNTT